MEHGTQRQAAKWQLEMPAKPPTFRPLHLPRPHARSAAREYRKGGARARGYSRQWEAAAKDHKRRHPLCVGCEALGFYVAAAVVDHVEPHTGNMDKFWDRDNWQGACTWCHSVLKQQLERQWKAGKLPTSALRLDSSEAVALSRRLRGL